MERPSHMSSHPRPHALRHRLRTQRCLQSPQALPHQQLRLPPRPHQRHRQRNRPPHTPALLAGSRAPSVSAAAAVKTAANAQQARLVSATSHQAHKHHQRPCAPQARPLQRPPQRLPTAMYVPPASTFAARTTPPAAAESAATAKPLGLASFPLPPPSLRRMGSLLLRLLGLLWRRMALHRMDLVQVRGSAVQLVRAETAAPMDMHAVSSAQRLLLERPVSRLRLHPARHLSCRSGQRGEWSWLQRRSVLQWLRCKDEAVTIYD